MPQATRWRPKMETREAPKRECRTLAKIETERLQNGSAGHWQRQKPERLQNGSAGHRQKMDTEILRGFKSENLQTKNRKLSNATSGQANDHVQRKTHPPTQPTTLRIGPQGKPSETFLRPASKKPTMEV